jgi:hypothetical protein
MNSFEKYLKYKKKYLELKKKLGGAKKKKNSRGKKEDSRGKIQTLREEIQTPRRLIQTKGNTGRVPKKEGEMYHQCFWMSILDYLNEHRYPRLTLMDLRKEAGLDKSTQTKMFDTAVPTFMEAAEKICKKYDLQIGIVEVYPDNYQILDHEFMQVIGNGTNKFRIAHFPSKHFELIINDNEIEASFAAVNLFNPSNTISNSYELPETLEKSFKNCDP